MARVIFLDERCKGCLLCTTVCPKEIIRQSVRFNRKGYKVAEVPEEHMEECTGCTACALICPDCAIRVYRPEKSARDQKAKE